MRSLQEKVESLYNLDRDERLWLDIAVHELRQRLKGNGKFVATNQFSRRRHKTTALLIVAIENKGDIVVPFGHHQRHITEKLKAWEEAFGIEHVPKVWNLNQGLEGRTFENGLFADELYKIDAQKIEPVLYQIRVGFMEQEGLLDLHRQGLL